MVIMGRWSQLGGRGLPQSGWTPWADRLTPQSGIHHSKELPLVRTAWEVRGSTLLFKWGG